MSAIPPQPPKVLAPPKVSRQFLDACEGEGFWAEDSNYAAALTFWLLECNSLRKYCLDLTAKMPPKGVSTRLNPVRLQTIPHLRVRRPNQHEQNPCVTIMSSMLSMSPINLFMATGVTFMELHDPSLPIIRN